MRKQVDIIETVKEAKRRLRHEMKDKMAALTEESSRVMDERIAGHLFELEEWAKAGVIFCYVGTNGEIDTLPILAKAWESGKRVGVPLCTGPGVMEVRQVEGMDDLVPGFYGILAPKESCPLLLPEEIALAVIPGLSFTKEGVRLGYGGGYYDRYLPQVVCPRIALCREILLSPELPAEPHDLPMDMVVTEHSTYLSNQLRKK